MVTFRTAQRPGSWWAVGYTSKPLKKDRATCRPWGLVSGPPGETGTCLRVTGEGSSPERGGRSAAGRQALGAVFTPEAERAGALRDVGASV